MAFGFGFGFPKNYVAAALSTFNPTSLFAAGEQGFYFDPNSTATLFEDAAGTIPTALERPVGLMLDQSKGLVLGTELVTNGDFSSGSTGWSLDTWVVSGGVATANNISGRSLSQSISLPSGSLYQIKFTISNYFSGNATVVFTGGVGTDYSATVSGNGEKTLLLKSSGARTGFVIYCGTSSSYSVDNISVRELLGNHATSNSTARPTLTRRVNLLSNTEDFSNSVWVKSGSITPSVAAPTFTTYTGIDPKGNTRTIYRFTFPNISTSNGFSILFQISSLAEQASVQYTNSIYIKRVSGGTQLPISLESSTTAPTSGGYSTSILTVTDSWAQYSATSTLSGTPSGNLTTIIGPDGRIASHLNLGAITVDIWGADLRPTNIGVDLPAYQRVGDTAINAADYDTTGFPAWLRCSGGQSMVTPSINFTSTDKMTVWAGVRRLTDVAGVISELSADWNSNTGSLLFWGGSNVNGTGNGFNSASRGSAAVAVSQFGYTPTVFTPPVSAVVCAIHNIAGNLTAVRGNGTDGTNGTGNKGTGTYGNYPLYLFARNQSSLFFNGLAGPIIVRGAQSSSAEIANAENWINAQQKVY